MTKPQRRQRLKELALIASLAATISVTACATNAPGSTTTVAGETASPSAAAASRPGSCQVNPSSAPMPTAEQFEPVPADARISVTMTGIPSGTVKPGDPATEVDVTLCNNSPVDYPKVGVVLVLTRCSCAITPIGLPEGTAERFDPAAGTWIKLDHHRHGLPRRLR